MSVKTSWRRTWVDDRPAVYGVVEPVDAGADGDDHLLPVVFLHGWAVGFRSYRQSIERLVQLGCRVYAPALPGFGGTPDLPRSKFSLTGYADWVESFLDVIEVREPVFCVGHSFGGGVATATAHRHPQRVRTLVLVNSIGGSMWRSKSIEERPLWHWGLMFPADIWPVHQAVRVVPGLLAEAVPNIVRNPRALWRVGHLARRADLRRELEELKRREVPVVVLWGARDGVIPRDSFDAICTAIGTDGEVVDGSHSWLMADPDSFGEIMTNHIEVARVAQSRGDSSGKWRAITSGWWRRAAAGRQS